MNFIPTFLSKSLLNASFLSFSTTTMAACSRYPLLSVYVKKQLPLHIFKLSPSHPKAVPSHLWHFHCGEERFWLSSQNSPFNHKSPFHRSVLVFADQYSTGKFLSCSGHNIDAGFRLSFLGAEVISVSNLRRQSCLKHIFLMCNLENPVLFAHPLIRERIKDCARREKSFDKALISFPSFPTPCLLFISISFHSLPWHSPHIKTVYEQDLSAVLSERQ